MLFYLNDHTAVVRAKDGRRLLETATTPLRVPGGPVDTKLVKTGEVFAPLRPSVESSISSHLGGGVTVGPGVRIVLDGSASQGSLTKDNTVFYPDATKDTDAAVTPTASGVDLSAALRSPASPEVLRYRVTLPSGLTLKTVGSTAVVYRGAKPVITIAAPSARDAQGSIVPAQMRVVGDDLVVSIDHHSGDLAYPILVDPQILVVSSTDGWAWQFLPGGRVGFSLPQPGTITAASSHSTPGGAWWDWPNSVPWVGVLSRVEWDGISFSTTSPGNFTTSFYTLGGSGSFENCFIDNYNPYAPPSTVVAQGSKCGYAALLRLDTTNTPVSASASLSISSMLITAAWAPGYGPGGSLGGSNPGEPNQVQACSGDPVNCSTGNFFETQTDLALNGRPEFALTRTYNSLDAVTQSQNGSRGGFGYGWSSSFTDHLIIDNSAGTVTVVQGNGSQVAFVAYGGGFIPATGSVQSTLSSNSDGTYTYTLPDQETESFDATGRLLSKTDRYGNALTFHYDGSGNLSSVTDGAGRIVTLTHNSDGTVSKATGPMGSITYGYDANGNLTRVTDLDGGVWQFAYDASHQLTTMTDPRGKVTTNTYDASNRVVSQKDGANRTRTWSYPTQGETLITNPAGDQVDEVFNLSNEPQRITRGYGTSSASSKSFNYDGSGNLTSHTDGNGHRWSYTYDGNGNRLTASDPLSHTTSWTYDSNRNVTSVTDPVGQTTDYTYTNNELTSESRAVAETGQTQTTSYGYDAQGDMTSMTDALGNRWTYGYDAAGNQTSKISPSGNKTTWAYDASGYLTSMVSPAGNASGGTPSQYTTTYTNDALGRPTTITDPLGHATRMSYDTDGNLASVTDPDSHTTTYGYDGANERTSVTRPDGTTQTSSYDGDGRLTAQTNGAGNKMTYAYDPRGDMISSTDPLNRRTNYGYDLAGNRTSVTDPQSRTATYGHDAANELTSISFSDGGTPPITYGYNANGQRTSMSDGTGSSSYGYDSLNRLTRNSDGGGHVVSYGYDLNNDVTSIVYPNSKTVTRAFDSDGRLQSLTDWLANKTTFGYDTNSNVQAITFPSTTGNVDNQGFNHADQMTSIQMKKGSSTLANLNYTRDSAGLLSGATEFGLPEPASQGPRAYSYDAADNPTQLSGSSGYSYDKANELTGSPGNTYGYDSLGERTAATPSSGNPTAYAYDQAGRLSSFKPPIGATTNYSYNGDELRTSKSNGTSSNSFTWDQTGSLPLVLGDGTNSYIYGPTGLPIEQIGSNGTPSYLHHDQLASTRLMTNQSGGVAAGFTYNPYGSLVATSGSSNTPLGYAGQYTDSESGLQYDRARYYSPATGQFISRDPLEAYTRVPYAYAHDNPTNSSDPSGLCGLGSLGDLGDCINPISSGNLAHQGAQWVVDHPGQAAELAAAGVCVAATQPELCLYAAGGAFAGRSIENGFSACSWSQFGTNEVMTGAETILGGTPGLLPAGLEAAGALGDVGAGTSVLPTSLAGRAALNTPPTAASATMTLLEPSISNSVPGAECSC